MTVQEHFRHRASEALFRDVGPVDPAHLASLQDPRCRPEPIGVAWSAPAASDPDWPGAAIDQIGDLVDALEVRARACGNTGDKADQAKGARIYKAAGLLRQARATLEAGDVA